MNEFPRTTVGGVSLPRMLMGTNWMLGWSHTSASADEMIRRRYQSVEAFKPVLEAYLRHRVDAIMAPFDGPSQHLLEAIRDTEQKLGRHIILIDTPTINVDDNPQARQEAQAKIQESARRGATFCLLHHSCAEQLVDKNKGVIRRLDDFTKMIRDAGMITGLSAHMPELIVYSDQNGYDVETYIQIFNCMGFLMQVEIETVASIIHHAKKPVMTIKSMAAGRCTPYVGLTFSWNAIRPQDMVTLGAFSPQEVEEDVEISLAAIEHRFPDLEKRSSTNQNQAAYGSEAQLDKGRSFGSSLFSFLLLLGAIPSALGIGFVHHVADARQQHDGALDLVGAAHVHPAALLLNQVGGQQGLHVVVRLAGGAKPARIHQLGHRLGPP